MFAPGDRHLTLIERLALLPIVPMPGRGRALFQPIWADDVADCVVAALDRDARARARYELAGPDTLTHTAVADLALRAAGRARPLCRARAVTRAGLQTLEALMKSKAPATWDEAELLQVSMTSRERHGGRRVARRHAARSMAAVLGARA